MADQPLQNCIEVRPIEATQACIVRAEVLRPHWTPVQCSWPMDEDPRTLHLGGFVNGELAGVASFIAEAHPQLPAELEIEPENMMKLRGMATRARYRRSGVGSAVLTRGMDELSVRALAYLWCNARMTAVPFYERHGWIKWGEEFDNPPVGPHIVMWKKLRGE
jgi:GNAT superfamily N-acetyltransferase